MLIRGLKVALTLIGFITAFVGLAGTPDDLVRWREWLELFGDLVFPDGLRGSLILSGIALIITVNVPGQAWARAFSALRQIVDRKYRIRRLVDRLGGLRASGVTLRNEPERPLWEDDVRSWEAQCRRTIRRLSVADVHYFDTLDIFHPRVGGSIIRQSLDGKLQRLLEIMRRHDPDFQVESALPVLNQELETLKQDIASLSAKQIPLNQFGRPRIRMEGTQLVIEDDDGTMEVLGS